MATSDTGDYLPSEQELDEMVAKAVAAAAKGMNIEQLQETMVASLPNELREPIEHADLRQLLTH